MTQLVATRVGLRGRIWLTVVVAIAAVLLALTAAFNLLVANRLDHDADTVVTARASAELDALKVTPAGIDLGETADAGAVDTLTWIFQGSRALEAPQLGDRAQAAALALTRAPHGYRDLAAADLRLYGVPIIASGRRVGTVVAAAGLAPYEQIRRIALISSSVLALLALCAVAAASRWMIARSLRPVSEMTQQAAEWSERQLDRRFALGEPRDEFTTLAATLDGLLDRVAASLRHEQNLTAELSHELRTPLAQISAETQYALRHGNLSDEQAESFTRVLESARQMTRILETLMTAARAQAAGAQASCDATAAARGAVVPFVDVAAGRGIALEVLTDAEGVRIPFEAGIVERILAPLLQNACGYARERVTVEISATAREVSFIVADDGPGITPEHAEEVFEPGFRTGTGGVALLQGAGLGLSLARRLTRGLGGDVRVLENRGGARVAVNVPRA
jgi:signal transduction histidine kinase